MVQARVRKVELEEPQPCTAAEWMAFLARIDRHPTTARRITLIFMPFKEIISPDKTIWHFKEYDGHVYHLTDTGWRAMSTDDYHESFGMARRRE